METAADYMEEEEEPRPQGFETEMFRFAKLIISDEDLRDVDPELRKRFWLVFDKELALSNFDKQDLEWLMLAFDCAKIDYMMSKYEDEIDFKKLQHLDMIKLKFIAKLRRSVGGMMRERALFAQQHQIKQVMVSEKDQPSGGILSKIASAFGRRE